MPATMPLPPRLSADESSIDRQYQPILSSEHQDNLPPLQTSRRPSHNSTESPRLCWRPFYLRRTVLLGFILTFIILIVTIEALLAVSNRDFGLATTTSRNSYLWTYGPTGLLTVLAALWARTEYQSKLVAPWIRLSRGFAPTSDTLLLDYVSQFSPFAIFTSFHKRDFIVSISITVSIIIKILIILSTSLISLSWIGVPRNSDSILLLDEFVNSNTKLGTISSLATFIVKENRNRDFILPDGISSNYAFQSIQSNLPDTAETQVTVNGLVNWVKCEPAHLTFAGAISPWPLASRYDNRYGSLNLTILSPGCNVSLANLAGVYDRSTPNNNSTLFARFNRIQCDTIIGDPGKRVLVIFGNLTYYTDYSRNISDYTYALHRTTTVNPKIGILNKSTNLLCTPEYAIDRVQVTRNNTRVKSVFPLSGAPRKTLEAVTAWDLMESQLFAGYEAGSSYVYGQSISFSSIPVDVDSNMLTAFTSQLEPELQVADLFDADVLQKTITSYYQQIGAVIAKLYLMAPTSTNTSTLGSFTLNENRLIVSSWIAQWVVALLAVCAVLTAITLFIVPSQGFLPCSPTNFPNLILIFRHSHELSIQLQYAGASDDKHLVEFFKQSKFYSGCSYDPISNQNRFSIFGNGKPDQFPRIVPEPSYPIILNPACRTILCLSIAGLIIALELLLQRSDLEDGLGTVENDTYTRYIWTVIPAILFGALSMAFSTIDFQIRTLVPYMALRQYTSRNIFKQLGVLDMSVPMAIYREIKIGTFWALATTIAFLAASLFTTFSASLFQALSIPAQPLELTISYFRRILALETCFGSLLREFVLYVLYIKIYILLNI